LFCPWGSPIPVAVQEGYYSTGGASDSTRTGQAQCEAGSYCAKGVRRRCRAGLFGVGAGLSHRDCSGKCSPGHYCPEGSTSKTQVRCPAGRFGAPLLTPSTTTSGSPLKWDYAATNNKNADGDYYNADLYAGYPAGDDKGLAMAAASAAVRVDPGLPSLACSGRCAAGYFCPEASTSPFERLCGGDGVYCPAGTGAPVPAKPGHFTVGGANATVRTNQHACEPGSYCSRGTKFDCPPGTFGSRSRLATPKCSGQCNLGHYCLAGSTSPTETPCPTGRFGATKGLGSSKCSGACSRAYECRQASVDQYGKRVMGGVN